MSTRRLELPLTYLATRVWYQPRVQYWILHFSTVTVVSSRSFRSLVLKPTFWTTKAKKRKKNTIPVVVSDNKVTFIKNTLK